MKRTIIILGIFFCVTNIAGQEILPRKSAVIDTVRRAQCKQIVDEINTMQLKCDTVGYVGSNWFKGIYFDNQGRLRKYFRKETQNDGTQECIALSAYYNEKGELIYLFSETSTDCDSGEEFYYIYKGCIVDFAIKKDCSCCEDGKDELTKKEINRIRPQISNPLKVSINWSLNLTNFIYSETLLKILQSKEYNDNDEFDEKLQ